LCRETVVRGWELHDGERPRVEVWLRVKARRRGRCGRCGELASFYDQGGGERRWRHIDVGFATCELIAEARRVDCVEHGPTVAAVPWARHDSAFTRAFEDLVVHDAIVGNKQAAADRYGVSWRAVNHMCVRVATEALGRVDLLDGLVAVAIDEVKYKKGQRYLTVVCDHVTGKVIWAAKGRSKDTVRSFFDALGDERAAQLQFVTADGATWITEVVAERAPDAIVCLDTFHVVSWATDALDEVRRSEWNRLRRAGSATAAKEFKGLRFLLRRNWEHLTSAQRGVIRDLEGANRRTFRAWQLKRNFETSSACRCSPPDGLSMTGWPTPRVLGSPRSSRSPAPSAATGPRSKRPSNGSSPTASPSPTTPRSAASAPTPAASTTPTPSSP
jgi:transposase